MPRRHARTLLLLWTCACGDKSSISEDPDGYTPGDTTDSVPAPDAECEEAAVDPAACCQPAEDSLSACTDVSPDGALIAGAFAAAAGDDAWTFTPTDTAKAKQAYTVRFSGTLVDALVPDLAALGEVWVRNGGGCGSDGEGATGGVFEIRDRTTEAPLLIVGAGQLKPEGGDSKAEDGRLSVTWGQALGEDCPARPGGACSELLVSHPVKVSYGGGAVILYQGQEAILNGLEIRILRAESAQGEQYCDDATGGGEDWVARATVSQDR